MRTVIPAKAGIQGWEVAGVILRQTEIRMEGSMLPIAVIETEEFEGPTLEEHRRAVEALKRSAAMDCEEEEK